MTTTPTQFWMNTVTLDHVEAAAAGGFTQADHGAGTRLRQPHPGDEMLFYSPRTELRGGAPVRQFTAWATITGEEPYQAHVSEDFHPWRLAATFHPSRPVDAKPLVEQPAPRRATSATLPWSTSPSRPSWPGPSRCLRHGCAA